jgi:APA family basic amino acid/polyamine antiporter
VTQIAAADPPLVRALSRWSLIALVVNGIIGTSVFILPGTLGGSLGWLSLGAWAIAALISGAIILSFAEVASRFTGAGGAYLFTRVAFGEFVGMQIGWLSYFVRCITGAVQSNLFVTYLAEFWPWAASRSGALVMTGLFLGLLAGVNVRGVGTGARVSNGFALVKVIPLLALGLGGMAWLLTQGSAVSHSGSDVTLVGWLEALLLLMFAFGGFESAVIPLAEARNPRRDIPAALLVGLMVATMLYLTAQVTVLATVAEPAATERPLAASARVLLGRAGATFMALVALISVYGWLAGNMLAVPRLSMALADRGDFPGFFRAVHPVYRTPWVSIVCFALVAWILANLAGLLQNLSLAAVSRLFTYGLVCAALPVLRRKETQSSPGVAPAAFQLPGGVVVAGVGVAGSLILASRMSEREALTLGLVVMLATAHRLLNRRRSG